MLLQNVYIAGEAGEEPQSIRIDGSQIREIFPAAARRQAGGIDLEGGLAFPGLINSHDHLARNLYPLIKRKIYLNYREWAADVQENYQALIRQIEKAPVDLHWRYGLCKNLLNGVTTVVQHDPLYTTTRSPLVDVHGATRPLHSPAFERNWRLKILRPGRKPVVMHLGEGTDGVAENEIREFLRWNRFGKKIVVVHGLALRPAQGRRFKALIWCPESNLELYGRTAAVDQLKAHIPILFGTDSTLSASWDLWRHLRAARRLNLLTDRELFQSLTTAPAGVWNLPEKGRLQAGRLADLVVAKKKEASTWDAFYALSPADILVVVKSGKAVLCDRSVFPKIQNTPLAADRYWEMSVENGKKCIAEDMPGLLEEIRSYYPAAGWFWEKRGESGG